MIEIVFFPLAFVISLFALLLICFEVGSRKGQRRNRLAFGSAGICTIIFAIGVVVAWQPWLQKSAVSSVDRFAEMSDQELLNLWQDESSAESISQTSIVGELQARLEAEALDDLAKTIVIKRATQMVIDDRDGTALSWLWQVRRWAIEGILSDAQTHVVLSRLIEENFNVFFDDRNKTSDRVSAKLRKSDRLPHTLLELLFPGERLSLQIEVFGIEIDGSMYKKRRTIGKSGDTNARGQVWCASTLKSASVEVPFWRERIAECPDVQVYLLTDIKLEEKGGAPFGSRDSDLVSEVSTLISLSPVAQRTQFSDPQNQTTHDPLDDTQVRTTHDPLAELLARAVIPDFKVTAKRKSDGYQLHVRSMNYNISEHAMLLPFGLSMDMEILGHPSCQLRSPLGLRRPPFGCIDPRQIGRSNPIRLSNGVSAWLDCVGDIPDRVDIRLYYSAPNNALLDNKYRYQPLPVFFDGEIVLADIPVVIEEPKELEP